MTKQPFDKQQYLETYEEQERQGPKNWMEQAARAAKGLIDSIKQHHQNAQSPEYTMEKVQGEIKSPSPRKGGRAL